MAAAALVLAPLGPEPKVTIAIYVKNAVRTIGRALDSALAQTWPHVEIAVIDGASTDGTVALVERYGARIAIFVSQPDSGAFEAANRAIARTSGPIICFLMADDWLEPQAAELIARAFIANPHAGIVSSGARIVVEGPDGSFAPVVERSGGENAFNAANILGMPLSAARYWRRETLQALGGFDGRYPHAHDRDLLMRALLAGVGAAEVEDCLYTYRQHAGSNTLGGHDDIILAFLAEHERMSAEWLNSPGLAPPLARQIRAWRGEQRGERVLLALHHGKADGILPLLHDMRALAFVSTRLAAMVRRRLRRILNKR